MAVTTIVHCDKCGERITQDRTSLKVVCGPLRTREPIDVCSFCADDLVKWLGPVPGRKLEPVVPMATRSRSLTSPRPVPTPA